MLTKTEQRVLAAMFKELKKRWGIYKEIHLEKMRTKEKLAGLKYEKPKSTEIKKLETKLRIMEKNLRSMQPIYDEGLYLNELVNTLGFNRFKISEILNHLEKLNLVHRIDKSHLIKSLSDDEAMPYINAKKIIEKLCPHMGAKGKIVGLTLSGKLLGEILFSIFGEHIEDRDMVESVFRRY